MQERTKIAVLYTGGTIGMQASEAGLAPSQASVLKALEAFQDSVDFDITVCEPLIDSSQVTPEHWCEWQQWVWQHQQGFDGLLVLHGTDTMAYSANVLAFCLGELNAPLVLTGSQYPLGTPHGDAEHNLHTAVTALQQGIAPKTVTIVFDGELLFAIGSRKISTQSLHGFDNKHQHVLARWQNGQWQGLQDGLNTLNPRGLNKVELNPRLRIASHYCLPVSEQFALRTLLESNIDGVIIQSFGHGNGLFTSVDIAALQAFQQQGGAVVNISQVADGHVAAAYAASQDLRQAGVVFAGNWTIETAYAKLWVGLSMGLRGKELSEMLQANSLGEWEVEA